MKSRRLYICGLMSLMLHAALVAGLLLRLEPKSATLVEAPDKPVMVELVMEEQKGAGETQTRPPAPKPAARQPAPTPPTPRKEAEPVPAQPPVQASTPTPPVPPSPAAATASPSEIQINIGGNDSESDAVAKGDAIIPANPDDKARNQLPEYPFEAARLHEHGAVSLLIHVSPVGFPEGVDVIRSSGYASLDSAARNAVLTWHFRPAIKDGLPIRFDFPFTFIFSDN